MNLLKQNSVQPDKIFMTIDRKAHTRCRCMFFTGAFSFLRIIPAIFYRVTWR